MERPAEGTVVRVKQLGAAGYEFNHPCFAIVRHHELRPSGQVDLQLIGMDHRDYRLMEKGYDMLTRPPEMTGFCAPVAHLEPGGEEGDVALARWALMGDRFFVKGVNNG